MLEHSLTALRLAARERGWRAVISFHILLAAVLLLFARTDDLYGFTNAYEKIVMVLALPFAAGDLFDRERRSRRALTLITLGLRAEAQAIGVIAYRIGVFLAGCLLLGILHRFLFAGPVIPAPEVWAVLVWYPLQCLGIILLAGLISMATPGWSNLLVLMACLVLHKIIGLGLAALSVLHPVVAWLLDAAVPFYPFVTTASQEVRIAIHPTDLLQYAIQVLLLLVATPFAFRYAVIPRPARKRWWTRLLDAVKGE